MYDIITQKENLYTCKQKEDEYDINVNKRRELDKQMLEINNQIQIKKGEAEKYGKLNRRPVDQLIKIILVNQTRVEANFEAEKQS